MLKQFQTLSILRKVCRPFSTAVFDYSAIEDPEVEVSQDQVKSDNNLFNIVNRNNTLRELTDFHKTNDKTLTLAHKVHFYNKVCRVALTHQGPEEEIAKASQVIDKVAGQLMNQLQDLDPANVTYLLKVMAFAAKKAGITFFPSGKNLSDIETKIVFDFHEYLKHDLSVSMHSLLKLQHYPAKILAELNQMAKFSIFKKD